MTDDVKTPQRLSQAYRELGAPEPPRALDEAILAAAKRSRRRWATPLATAAVLVLAVAVTLNLQRERPGVEFPVTQAPPPRADQSAEKISSANAEAELKLRAAAELKLKPRPEPQRAANPAAPAVPAAAPALPAREPQPFAAAQAPSRGPAFPRSEDARGAASSVTGELARKMEERTARDAEAAALTPRLGAFQAQKRAELPERELERIADLRVQGRHDEADRALAEFRKRYPDYRIADAMRERVERR